MKKLENKLALVTGASSGLGAHFAEVLAGAGAEVILAARREDKLAKIAEGIRAAGGRCSTAQLDVANSASIARLAPHLPQIDILVNNAGLAREAGALAMSEADWDVVMDTNLKGMFLVAQLAGQAMRAHGRGGAIINIASILGLRESPGVLAYAVSKAGAIQLTKSMALELARFNIRVNAIAPGYLSTEMNATHWDTEAGKALIRRIPQRRLGRLQDLNGPLLLLASDDGAYMTGSVIAVDGGHLLSGL